MVHNKTKTRKGASISCPKRHGRKASKGKLFVHRNTQDLSQRANTSLRNRDKTSAIAENKNVADATKSKPDSKALQGDDSANERGRARNKVKIIYLDEIFLRSVSIYNGQIFSWEKTFNDRTYSHWIEDILDDILNDPNELTDTSLVAGSA